jgi:16S rRNA (adenine1518-N6/adenine1519-N6)-dimethyltransferase
MEKYNITDILKKYKLNTKKKFGQNFLINNNILNKIVAVAGNIENENILEIGAGPGGLTNAILMQKPQKIISIEIDKNYYSVLKNEFLDFNNFEIINDDAMKVIYKNLFTDKEKKIKIISNLPYNIGTHLLLKWIKEAVIFDSFTLLLQKEVVDRIVATPNKKEYGRLSVLLQTFADCKKIFDVKPSNFIPSPKVISSVVHIKIKKNIDVNFEKISKITSILFNNRRKKIRTAIENFNIKSCLNLDRRAEELTVDDFINLTKINN